MAFALARQQTPSSLAAALSSGEIRCRLRTFQPQAIPQLSPLTRRRAGPASNSTVITIPGLPPNSKVNRSTPERTVKPYRWQQWFATQGGVQWREDYEQRMDPTSELEEGLKALVVPAASTTVRLLDVGSGPATSVGKVWTGYDLQITAIDPLADEYADLYRGAGVSPPIVPLKLDGEKLSSRLPVNYFDIVHTKNAIDHSYNAPQVLREMVAVVKPGGAVVVLVNENVAEREQQWGLHQWNFEAVPRLGDGPNGGVRDAFVYEHGEAVEVSRSWAVTLWNAHGRVRMEQLLRSQCAAVERIRVLEGYKEYAARYLELHIRKSRDCPA